MTGVQVLDRRRLGKAAGHLELQLPRRRPVVFVHEVRDRNVDQRPVHRLEVHVDTVGNRTERGRRRTRTPRPSAAGRRTRPGTPPARSSAARCRWAGPTRARSASRARGPRDDAASCTRCRRPPSGGTEAAFNTTARTRPVQPRNHAGCEEATRRVGDDDQVVVDPPSSDVLHHRSGAAVDRQLG